MDRIFVYGTLRPSLYPQRTPDTLVEHATLTDKFKMYKPAWFPCLAPSIGEYTIIGETYEIPSVRIFDAYEGYRQDGTGLFDRKIVRILTDGRLLQDAWVYFMKIPPDAPVVITGDWADVVRGSVWAD